MTCSNHGEECPDLGLRRTVRQPGGGPIDRFGKDWFISDWIFADDFSSRGTWAIGTVGEVAVSAALEALPTQDDAGAVETWWPRT